MFIILNRLRGTYSIFAKINGVLLGLLFYFITNNYFTGTIITILYIVGESFGWGEWIGALINNRKKCIECNEGKKNGIYQFVSLFANPHKNFYLFSYIALIIRGFYWFGPIILLLLYQGYISYQIAILAIVLLSWGFPISIQLGKLKPLIFKFKFFKSEGVWTTAELYYGLIQDIVFIGLIWRILNG